MKSCNLPCDWEIFIPDNWLGEYNEEDGQYMLYPNNSDLTIRITPFLAEQNGVPAPAEMMKIAFIGSIPTTAVPRDANSFELRGFAVKMYEGTIIEDNQTVYVIYVGYYSVGELLSINIFATDKAECEQALDIIKTIKKSTH